MLRQTLNFKKATHVAHQRKVLKRRPSKPRMVESLWICNRHLELSGVVTVDHVNPRTKRQRDNHKRALELMRCPICGQQMIFMGYNPPTEFIEPADLTPSRS